MTVARRGPLDKLPLALRFALRDLIGDRKGFGAFIACIVIGVAAISGVNGLSRALSQGLAREGRADTRRRRFLQSSPSRAGAKRTRLAEQQRPASTKSL